jgi:hypothetical protein
LRSRTITTTAPCRARSRSCCALSDEPATTDHGLADPRSLDFAPNAHSLVVDAGIELDGERDVPTLEYVHPVAYRKRQRVARIDIGPYERCGL